MTQNHEESAVLFTYTGINLFVCNYCQVSTKGHSPLPEKLSFLNASKYLPIELGRPVGLLSHLAGTGAEAFLRWLLWRNTWDHQSSGAEALGSFSRQQMKQQGKDRHLLELRAHLSPGRHHVSMLTQYFPASAHTQQQPI